ncbi:MAG: hypothetical protein ACRD9L_05080 [Bryobacteraceae bacterium]
MTQPPPGAAIHSAPAELRIKARLAYETVEPTLIGFTLVWAACVFAAVIAFVAGDWHIPDWFGMAFAASLIVLGALFVAAIFLNHVRLSVDRDGVTTGIRPVPVAGFPYWRRLRTLSIAGIYVAQRDLWLRMRPGLRRSFEVHALTTAGEPVCLAPRLPNASAAEELAQTIRERLGAPLQTESRLRGRMRSASQPPFQFAGFLPSWLFWLLLLLIGLEVFAMPLVRIAGWHRVSATVVRAGAVYRGRRACVVQFQATGGSVSSSLQNGCARRTKPGVAVAIYYNPRRPAAARALLWPQWPAGLLFSALGCLGLAAARGRPKYFGTARILWDDGFQYLSRYWNLRPQNADAAKGVLTLSGLSGALALPHTQYAFEPAAVQVRIETGEPAGPNRGAGILFAAPRAGTGYVFGIVPQVQNAFALRQGSGEMMLSFYVREIRPRQGDSNVLKVVLAGGRARFFVNGASAGGIGFDPPLGGGMVGLYADFGNSQTVWRFSELLVLDADPDAAP